MVGSNHENLSHKIFLTKNNMLYNLRICKCNTAERGQNGSTVIPAVQGRFTGPKGLTFIRSTSSNNRSCDPDHENILTQKSPELRFVICIYVYVCIHAYFNLAATLFIDNTVHTKRNSTLIEIFK